MAEPAEVLPPEFAVYDEPVADAEPLRTDTPDAHPLLIAADKIPHNRYVVGNRWNETTHQWDTTYEDMSPAEDAYVYRLYNALPGLIYILFPKQALDIVRGKSTGHNVVNRIRAELPEHINRAYLERYAGVLLLE